MHIIFRDDDTSFFTTPAMLETVYAPLWERGLPVCLAVIPMHDANNIIPPYKGFEIDPNIPPAYRGIDQRYSIADNPELCAFLNQLAAQGLVEICLHGYTHRYLECMTEDKAAFRQNLQAGLALFEKAFPRVQIRTFITPYDRVSASALEQILDMGFNTCVFPQNVPTGFGSFKPNTVSLCRGQSLFVNGMPSPLLEHAEWEALLAQGGDDSVYVCLNHYWEFFGDWGEPDQTMLDQWRAFIALASPYFDRVGVFTALSLN